MGILQGGCPEAFCAYTLHVLTFTRQRLCALPVIYARRITMKRQMDLLSSLSLITTWYHCRLLISLKAQTWRAFHMDGECRMSCRCRGCHELQVPLASQECHRCHGSLWCRGLQVHVGAEDSQDAGLLQIVGVRGPRNVDFLIAAWSGAYCNWPVQKKQVKKLAALADEGLELTAQLGATRARRGRC